MRCYLSNRLFVVGIVVAILLISLDATAGVTMPSNSNFATQAPNDYFYHGEPQSNNVAQNTPYSIISTQDETDDSGYQTKKSTDNEVRLLEMEQKLRDLTGQLEENSYKLKKLNDSVETIKGQLQKLIALQQADTSIVDTAPQAPAITINNKPASENKINTPITNVQSPIPTTSPSSSLGVVKQSADKTISKVSESPESLYEKAFSLLSKSDYQNAENEFYKFISQYPDHKLAANAFYWLAETYYVRADYQKAAVYFAEGFQKHPDGPKAADNLLKLAMTLGKLEKTSDACITFSELFKRYPTLPDSVKTRAEQERQKLNCQQ